MTEKCKKNEWFTIFDEEGIIPDDKGNPIAYKSKSFAINILKQCKKDYPDFSGKLGKIVYKRATVPVEGDG